MKRTSLTVIEKKIVHLGIKEKIKRNGISSLFGGDEPLPNNNRAYFVPWVWLDRVLLAEISTSPHLRRRTSNGSSITSVCTDI